jgi:cupin fold WbuC family metalloprotein
MLVKITSNNLDKLSEKAKHSERKRMNFNFHKQPDDTLQRMIHVMHRGTYVQPHKHENPDKREAFIILRGRVALIEFDNEGKPTDHIIMDKNEGNFGVEVPPKIWHNLIALEDNSAVYEVKDGPYSPVDDKNFAQWAPKEGDKECKKYLKNLIRKLELS